MADRSRGTRTHALDAVDARKKTRRIIGDHGREREAGRAASRGRSVSIERQCGRPPAPGPRVPPRRRSVTHRFREPSVAALRAHSERENVGALSTGLAVSPVRTALARVTSRRPHRRPATTTRRNSGPRSPIRHLVGAYPRFGTTFARAKERARKGARRVGRGGRSEGARYRVRDGGACGRRWARERDGEQVRNVNAAVIEAPALGRA